VTPADGREMQSGSNQNHRDVHSEKNGYFLHICKREQSVQLNKLPMKTIYLVLIFFLCFIIVN